MAEREKKKAQINFENAKVSKISSTMSNSICPDVTFLSNLQQNSSIPLRREAIRSDNEKSKYSSHYLA